AGVGHGGLLTQVARRAHREPLARATVENVLGKNYWLSAAREGLTVGAPRTLLVSATADF
ncbi:MAG: hypothetical protein EOO24_60950, partial [Comamonadaceae bacterium]